MSLRRNIQVLRVLTLGISSGFDLPSKVAPEQMPHVSITVIPKPITITTRSTIIKHQPLQGFK